MAPLSHVVGEERVGSSAVVTNLPDVDDAWPGLLATCIALCDAIAAAGRESAIENLFQDLVERAIEIFRREEDVLSASSEPNAILHRQGHLAILSVVARMRAEHRDHGGSPDLALRMRAELLDFIREHHALLDAMLGRHVREWSLRTRLEGE